MEPNKTNQLHTLFITAFLEVRGLFLRSKCQTGTPQGALPSSLFRSFEFGRAEAFINESLDLLG